MRELVTSLLARAFVGRTHQTKMSVAISEDRKSILLMVADGVEAVLGVESARIIGEALLDCADELDPPQECPHCGPISVALAEHTCPHQGEGR